MKFQAIKGVRDILPPDSALWNRVEQTAREVFSTYGYGEIRLPIFEPTELFRRAVGDETDVVSKEMYTFYDPFNLEELKTKRLVNSLSRGPAESESFEDWAAKRTREFEDSPKGDVLSLRPEATASVVRAYIEHGMQVLPSPVRLSYLGPMFRRERPQKGRYRQFYQIGAEVLGSNISHFAIDADMISMFMSFFDRCGLTGHVLYLNSIGCRECRPEYVKLLSEALLKVKERLGPDSQRRITTNPLRVLDSKAPDEQEVIEGLPTISSNLCQACRDHFEGLKTVLDRRGIKFKLKPRMVRGLDYYVRTIFEVTAPGQGSQDAICGGGRYDGLVELIGGPKFKDIKGVGFAIGEDRLIEALQHENIKAKAYVDVLVAWNDQDSREHAEKIAQIFRLSGLVVEVPVKPMPPLEGLGIAKRRNIPVGVFIGPSEVSAAVFSIRLLSEGDQASLKESEAVRSGRLLRFRVLLQRDMEETANSHGVDYKGLPLPQLATKLTDLGILNAGLVPRISTAVDTFNKMIHGMDVTQEQESEAIVASISVLDELSGQGPRLRFQIG